VSKTLKLYDSVAKAVIEHLEMPIIPNPGTKSKLGVDGAHELDLKIWDREVDELHGPKEVTKNKI
jgi:hypothetical protein